MSPTKGNVTVAEVAGTNISTRSNTTYTVDGWGRVTTVTAPLGAQTTTAYHGSHGYVTSVTDATSNTVNFSYDTRMRPVSATDLNTTANGNGADRITRLEHDDYNRLIRVYDPTNTSTVFGSQVYTYSNTFPKRIYRDNLIWGAYVRQVDFVDGSGRAVQTDSPTSNTAYAGTRVGQIQAFNGAGNPMYATDGTIPMLGAPGNNLVQPNWVGMVRWTSNDYDQYSRVTGSDYRFYSGSIASTSISYDGYTTTALDAEANKTANTVDVHGNLVSVDEFSTPTASVRTEYTYDQADRLTSVSDADNNVTTITPDMAGRKTAMNDPDTGDWSYTYDLNHRMTSQTEQSTGQQLHFAYDALDRPTTTRANTSSGPLLRQFSYDASGEAGLIDAAVSYENGAPAATWTYTYDLEKQPLSETLQIHAGPGAGSSTTSFTYTPDGQLNTVTYPNSIGGTPVTVAYQYDSFTGHPVSMFSYLSGIEVADTDYDWAGRVLTQTLGDPASPAGQYEAVYSAWTNQLQELRAKRGTATFWDLMQNQYGYDANFNISFIKDLRNPWFFGAQFQCFDYDHRNRLAEAFTHMTAPSTFGADPCVNATASDTDGTYTADSGTTFDRTYGYDDIGNLASRSESWGGTQNWTYNYGAGPAGPHAVTSTTGATTATYGYEDGGVFNAGNVEQRSIAGQPSQDLDYDEFNQLTSVSAPGTATETYTYDAYGTRVRQSTSPTQYRVTAGKWYEKTPFPGLEDTLNFWFAGRHVAYQNGPFLSYLYTDHLGSTAASHSVFGNTFSVQRYLPFGDRRGTTAITSTTFDFTGQKRDAYTDLLYYQSRYYDPLFGRFTQPDTIVPGGGIDPQMLNRYSYVRNNPVRYTDPSGHVCEGGVSTTCVAGLVERGYETRRERAGKAHELGQIGDAEVDEINQYYDDLEHVMSAQSSVSLVPGSLIVDAFRLLVFDDRACRSGSRMSCGIEVLLALPHGRILDGLKTTKALWAARAAPRGADAVRWLDDIRPDRLQHIRDRHLRGGAQWDNNTSYFNNADELESLVTEAADWTPIIQSNGNLATVVDAGRPIGWDAASGAQTNLYTVIIKPGEGVWTAHPGLPRVGG